MVLYVFVAFASIVIIGALVMIIILLVQEERGGKKTRAARRCPNCSSTSFEDKSLKGVKTDHEQLPSDGIKDLVRRTCNKCGHVWYVEVTTIFTLESESYSLPDGFHGPPYKYD